MNITTNFNTINFKGVDFKPQDINANKNRIHSYLQQNADVFVKAKMGESDKDIEHLAMYDYERTKGIMDVVKKRIRGAIINDRPISPQDEKMTDLSNLKYVVSYEKMSPGAFSDLLSLNDGKKESKQNDPLHIVDTLHDYEEIGSLIDDDPDDYLDAVDEFDELMTPNLGKREVDRIPETSELMQFDYIKDLKAAKSVDEVVQNMRSKAFEDSVIFMPTHLIATAAAKTFLEKTANEQMQENMQEQIESYRHCLKKNMQIKLELGTDIPMPEEVIYSPEEYSKVFDDTYKELKAWEKAGKNEFRAPKELYLSQYDTSIIRKELRSELVSEHDTKRGKDIHITNNFGLSDSMAQFNILHKGKYANELINAGVPYYMMEDAHKSTNAFISAAARGDFSKYSDELKQTLVDFGMPKWVLNLPDIE